MFENARPTPRCHATSDLAWPSLQTATASHEPHHKWRATVKKSAKSKLLLLAGCMCQQEERHWLAAVAHTCGEAKIPLELAKLYVSGPLIFNKNGPRIVAGKWAQNLGHTPGCCCKFRQGPCFGHETVARKRAHNRDRVLCKNTNLEPPKTQTWTAHPSSARLPV